MQSRLETEAFSILVSAVVGFGNGAELDLVTRAFPNWIADEQKVNEGVRRNPGNFRHVRTNDQADRKPRSEKRQISTIFRRKPLWHSAAMLKQPRVCRAARKLLFGPASKIPTVVAPCGSTIGKR